MIWGLFKLSEENHIDTIIADFRAEKARLKAELDLDAQIMLSLGFERTEIEENGLKFSYHDLFIYSRDTATYMTERGEIIDFVEQSGISVPEKQHVGRVYFLDEKLAQGKFSRYANALIRRDDERGGQVYALNKEVSAVLMNLHQVIEALEAHEVDIKALCPHAKTDISGPVSVSVAGMGTYFNRFAHFPGTEMHDNYHSARKRDGEKEEIIFLPSNTTVIVPSVEQRQVC